MVCLSGGKDSYTLLHMLLGLQRSAPAHFELVAVNLNQQQPGFPAHVLPDYLEELGVSYYVVNRDTWSVVKSRIPEGKTACGLCSRLRRGALYAFAEQIGATRIALGHHQDDIVETLFLNMFYGARLAAMPPKLRSDDGRNLVIRPLAYCREKDIAAFSALMNFPIIPCTLCGSQENLQRQNIKAMLAEWDTSHPGRIESIFNAMQSIAPSQMADSNLFDFASLEIDRSTPRPTWEHAGNQIVQQGGPSGEQGAGESDRIALHCIDAMEQASQPAAEACGKSSAHGAPVQACQAE